MRDQHKLPGTVAITVTFAVAVATATAVAGAIFIGPKLTPVVVNS